MSINTNQIVSILDANMNFNKVARVSVAVATGKMEYDDLLERIRRNKTK